MNKKGIFIRLLSLVLALVMVFGASTSTFAVSNQVNSVYTEEEERIQDKIVAVARAQKGYYESNANKFTEWYFGFPTDTYWCTIFVSWCAGQVGASGTAIPKRSTVDGMRQWFILKGQYYSAESDYVPQKGDIVFMNTELDGTNNVHHVEIITEDGYFGTKRNPKIKCIGGNTSNSNYEGSEYVTEKTRPVNGSRAVMVGYAHPSYEKSNGIMGLIYTLFDVSMPAYVKLIYSKFISLIQAIQTPEPEVPATQSIIF